MKSRPPGEFRLSETGDKAIVWSRSARAARSDADLDGVVGDGRGGMIP